MPPGRMHTSGEVACLWGGCMPPGRVHASGGCMPPGGLCASRGVHASRGCMPPGDIPACTEADPPVNRITYTSKNITLATASLRPVKIYGYQMIGKDRG